MQPCQGAKRRWFEFDALGLRLVKAASLLQCPFDAKKDPLVTRHFSPRPFSRKGKVTRLNIKIDVRNTASGGHLSGVQARQAVPGIIGGYCAF